MCRIEINKNSNSLLWNTRGLMSSIRRDSRILASLPAECAFPFSRMAKSMRSCLRKGGMVML